MKTNKMALVALAMVISVALVAGIAFAHGMNSKGMQGCPMMAGGSMGDHAQMHKQMHSSSMQTMHGQMTAEKMQQMHKLHHGE